MAIRSYYGPLTGLILFAVFLQTNQLLTRREKNLFACELTGVGMMLLATSVDACVSQASEEVQWRARAIASALQFALAPMAPFFSGTAVSPYAPDQAAAVCLAGGYQFFGSDRRLAYRIGCPAWTAGTIHPGAVVCFSICDGSCLSGMDVCDLFTKQQSRSADGKLGRCSGGPGDDRGQWD